jgi:hypothetical protein
LVLLIKVTLNFLACQPKSKVSIQFPAPRLE